MMIILKRTNRISGSSAIGGTIRYFGWLTKKKQEGQQQQQQQQQTRLLTTQSSSSSSSPELTFQLAQVEPSLVDLRNAPNDFIPSSAVVYQNFITEEEGDQLSDEIQSLMKRRRYEKGHWDAVITKYKEIEVPESQLSSMSQNAFQRVRYQILKCHIEKNNDGSSDNNDNTTTTTTVKWLPCHAIDLHKDGELNAHVDSIRFSGHLVCGLSLLSPSIMRLRPSSDGGDDNNNDTANTNDTDSTAAKDDGTNNNQWIDLFLPTRSLYVMSGVSRYNYSHELLPTNSIFHCTNDDGTGTGCEEQNDNDHSYSNIIVPRDRRLSIIFRDSKTTEDEDV